MDFPASSTSSRPNSPRASRFVGGAILLAGLLLATATSPAEPASASAAWRPDFEHAVELARASERHTLLLFTGLGWEEWSQRLEDEVLARPEFASALAADFVLTRVDLPQTPRPDVEPDGPEARRYALAAKFRLHVFPSIYLCTPGGQPYALVGYLEGGPEIVLREIRAKRDAYTEFTAKLAALAGPDRARAIHAWLETLPEPLRELHTEKIQQIIDADPTDSTGLRSKYRIAQTLPRARQARYSGQLEDAERLYRNLIEETRPQGETLQALHYELADIHFQRKDYDALLDELDLALAAAPGSNLRGVLDEMFEVFTRQWIWTRHDRAALAAADYDHTRLTLPPDATARFAQLVEQAKTVAPRSTRNQVLDRMAETLAAPNPPP